MNECSSIALQNDSPSTAKSSGRCTEHLTLNLSDSSDCYETHKTTAANFSSYTMSYCEKEKEEEGNLLKILLNMPERKFSTHSKACTEQILVHMPRYGIAMQLIGTYEASGKEKISQ